MKNLWTTVVEKEKIVLSPKSGMQKNDGVNNVAAR